MSVHEAIMRVAFVGCLRRLCCDPGLAVSVASAVPLLLFIHRMTMRRFAFLVALVLAGCVEDAAM
jgi:hypothetical protein